MQIFLYDADDVSTLSYDHVFNIEILDCLPENLDPQSPVLDYSYVLGSGPEKFIISNYNQNPNCGKVIVSVSG
jgi:hypothetical protein